MLRAQLDPHFLFNSLNGIAAEVHAHPDDAVEMICRLSDYLRYSLEHRKQTFTALESELGAMQAYLEIEKARFGDRLRFSVDASPDALTHRVPPFILQPLVENALKWGFHQSASAMTVDIRAFQTGGVLEIEVMNNGHLRVHPARQGRRTRARYPQSTARYLLPGAAPLHPRARGKSRLRDYSTVGRGGGGLGPRKKTSHLALSLAESEPVPQGSTLP